MQTYDMLIVLVLVAATLFGFWKGMAWQVASLASLVVSYFAALHFADQLAPKISNQAPWNKFVAMLAIYVGTSFIIWTLFRLVSGVIDRVKLDGFDHQMGALIGFAKGVLLSIAITFFAVTILPENQKNMIMASRTGEYVVLLLDKSHTVVPPEIHDVIHPYVDRIEKGLNPNHQSHPHHGSSYASPLPTNPSFGWPQSNNQNSNWPAEPQQPSVYEPPRNAWPQQQPAQQQPQPRQIPAWPNQQQTADRPTGAPL